jgi:hypothetical protein
MEGEFWIAFALLVGLALQAMSLLLVPKTPS